MHYSQVIVLIIHLKSLCNKQTITIIVNNINQNIKNQIKRIKILYIKYKWKKVSNLTWKIWNNNINNNLVIK